VLGADKGCRIAGGVLQQYRRYRASTTATPATVAHRMDVPNLPSTPRTFGNWHPHASQYGATASTAVWHSGQCLGIQGDYRPLGTSRTKTSSVAGKRNHGIIEDMKEVLTKRFWLDVKKTFDEARADPTSNIVESPVASAVEAKPQGISAAEIPEPPEADQSSK
jgi:hypothetical protein